MNSVRVLRTQCAGQIRTAISVNVVASDVIRVIGPANIRAASIAVVVGLVAVIIEPAHTRGGVRPSPGRQSSTAATSAGLAILSADRSRCSGWRRQLPRPCNTFEIASFVQLLLDSHK